MMDAWRSVRVRDSLWNPPLRTLRLSGDLPFLQWTLVSITEGDPSPANQELSALIMESYGDRFRYIPGGNPAAVDAAVSAWLENEGLT